MLVLSRRPQQRFLFPTLGISVEVLHVQGSTVKLGIAAPPAIAILREEIAGKAAVSPPAEQPGAQRLTHATRGRLNTAVMALHLAQKQVQKGLLAEADATLQEALTTFADLEQHLTQEASPPAALQALLVEDNPNEGSLLTSYLRLSGFTVETAADGYEALEYLRQRARPDVVLVDMRMPRCDGPSTVAAIRGNPALQGLKVFGVSGTPPTAWNLAAGPTGVDGWFAKPLNPERIVRTLRAATLAN